MISSKPSDKIEAGEKFFNYLKKNYTGLPQPECAFFYNDGIEGRIGFDIGSAKHNKTIDPEELNPNNHVV